MSGRTDREAMQAAMIAAVAYVLQGICYGFGAAIGASPVAVAVTFWWLS